MLSGKRSAKRQWVCSVLYVLFMLVSFSQSPRALAQAEAEASGDFVVGGQYVILGTNETVHDAKVHLIRQRGVLGEPELLASSLTDQEGKFRFEGLEPPNQIPTEFLIYRVVCDAQGFPINTIRYAEENSDPDDMKIGLYPKQIQLNGRVLDHQGKPAVGAIVGTEQTLRLSVALGLCVDVTDADGNFQIQRVAQLQIGQDKPRPNKFYVDQKGYPRFSSSTMPGEFANVRLVEGCRLTGRVIHGESKQGLPGVMVSAAKTKSGASGHSTLTDDRGRYELIVTEGNYNIMLENSDLVAPALADIECPQGQELVLDPLVATPGGWLTGRVIHPRTGQPVITGNGNERIRVGVYGPARPDGYALASEVNSDGRFRIRVAPGENYPYLLNQQSERMSWDTKKQEPVMVVEGEVARCFINIKVDRTDEEKMIDAAKAVAELPEDKVRRAEAILARFRKLNHTVDDTELWCSMMRDLIKIGSDAVPAICKELDATSEQRMMRRLGFALRSINDPRAVPTLIRAIPKTLQPSMSDYGLIVGDADLLAFMQDNDLNEKRGGRHFGFGRPVREVFGALNELTSMKLSESELYHIHRAKDPRTKYAQQQQFQAVAEQWRDWWQKNWQSFDLDDSYRAVKLPALPLVDISSLPSGLNVTEQAEIDRSVSGTTLTAIGDKGGRKFYLDLDTGRAPKLPESVPRDDASPGNIHRAAEWAAANGPDLICVRYGSDKKHPYALRGIGLQLWEISPLDAKNISKRLMTGKLPTGRKINDGMLLHLDPVTKQLRPKLGSSFLYLTSKDGLGIITITDSVIEARDITGMFSTPKGVGFNRGVRFDWKTIVR